MERKVLKLSTKLELDALGRCGKEGTEVVNKLGAGCFREAWKGRYSSCQEAVCTKKKKKQFVDPVCRIGQKKNYTAIVFE